MSGCIIKKCNCKHEGQDKIHGQGQRVHNITQKGEQVCTVCGTKTK